MKFRLIEPIEVEFADKTRRLLITQSSLRKAEKQLNAMRAGEPKRSIYAIVQEESSRAADLGLSADFASVMLWASLLHEEPEITFDDAERLLGDPLAAYRNACSVVQRSFFGEPEESSKSTEDGEVDSPIVPLDRLNGTDSGPLP